MTMSVDTLIANGMVLVAAEGELIREGYVAIREGRICAVGPMAELGEPPAAVREIDATGRLVMPGLINGHTHAAMTLFRGLADDLPLMTWLQEYIFPAEGRVVRPEVVYWGTKLAAAEMLLSGTTMAADSYFCAGAAAQAFSDIGMRAIVAQGVIDFPAPGVADAADNVRVAADFIAAWQGKNPLLTPAVFCHSPYTCSPLTLRAAKALSRRQGTLFFIHLAETEEEVAQIKARYGVTPVGHLAGLGVLDRQTVCVHGVWLTPEDIGLLKASGCGVVTCPESNMKLAAGIAPLPGLLAAGVVVGLGSDGAASNNDLDLFREMDSCAKLHKVAAMDPTVLPARQVLGMATRQGARVLGMGGVLGELAVGKMADLIILDLQQPHLTPIYNRDLLVYAARGADVRTVLIGGRLVVEEGRLLTCNLREVLAKVRELSQEVKERWPA